MRRHFETILMTTPLTGHRLITAKIARSRNKLAKEDERHSALKKELKQIKKMEKLIIVQEDEQRITRTKQGIANIYSKKLI